MKHKNYFVVPATHIDLVWKKDRDEHEEILEATSVRLLDVLDHFPQYKYIIEQAAHFRVLASRRPDLISRLRTYIKQGRLEFVGGLASSAETNGPSGESFIRNQLLGLRFTSEVLGAKITSGYLIDTFGLHAQMPQVLRQFGLDRIMANRFGGVRNKDVFVVTGLDGSRLLVAGRDVNSPHVAWERVFFAHCRNYPQIKELFGKAAEIDTEGPHLVMPYNEYDGIASTYIAQSVDEQNAGGEDARWTFATLSEFFDAIPGPDGEWPEYTSDLNPEFTGTFAQRTQIRTLHRTAETQLIEAEGWAVLLKLVDWRGPILESWWNMAFVESHDVYTGSHPTSVYNDTIDQLRFAEREALRLLQRAAESITHAGSQDQTTLVVLNCLPFARDAVIKVSLPELLGDSEIIEVVDDEDVKLPFEVDGTELIYRTAFSGMSAKRLLVKTTKRQYEHVQPDTGNNSADRNRQPGSVATIQNEHVTVTVDQVGGLAITTNCQNEDKRVTIHPQITLQEDRGNFQIEDLKSAEVSSRVFPLDAKCVEVSEVRSRLIVSGRFPALWGQELSPLEWEMECTIYPERSGVDLSLRLNWSGEAARARLKLETDIHSSDGVFEIPFGAVTRSPYHSRRTARGEWPVHRWVAVEENTRGVALINKGHVGAEAVDGQIWTSLLRAPTTDYAGMIPDDTSSQHGQHTFEFNILPYVGSWKNGEVIERAQEVNAPVHCYALPTAPLEQETCLVVLQPSTAVLSGIKAPEDSEPDEIIVRFYQATGERTETELFIMGAEAAWNSDMLEAKGEAAACNAGRILVGLDPFEIKTLRVRLN